MGKDFRQALESVCAEHVKRIPEESKLPANDTGFTSWMQPSSNSNLGAVSRCPINQHGQPIHVRCTFNVLHVLPGIRHDEYIHCLTKARVLPISISIPVSCEPLIHLLKVTKNCLDNNFHQLLPHRGWLLHYSYESILEIQDMSVGSPLMLCYILYM